MCESITNGSNWVLFEQLSLGANVDATANDEALEPTEIRNS
jgi:hypothetical protein